jgi:hypothetical protein
MRSKLQKGEIVEGLMIVLAIAIVAFVLLGKTGAPGTTGLPSFFGSQNNGNGNNTSVSSSGTPLPTKTSPYENQIHLESGSAANATEPYQEYVTLVNNGNTSIDVTGWQLSNARGSRTYSVGESQQTFASEVVTIPQGTALISSTPATPQDIILKPGESVDVVTGSAGTSYPYKINSFKENECTGYLTQQSADDYSFSPSLQQSCIAPRNEPGANNLDLSCQNYIEDMQSCHTPKYNTVDSQGNTCNGCVDGNSSLSDACVAYIETHFSYESCVADHENDSNFYGSIWHVYLNRAFELWAASHEVITLYDTSGKVVDYISY